MALADLLNSSTGASNLGFCDVDELLEAIKEADCGLSNSVLGSLLTSLVTSDSFETPCVEEAIVLLESTVVVRFILSYARA